MNSNPQLELMETPTIDFSLKEKLAIVNALDSVIHADGKVHTGEINALSELMNSLDFDSNFIVQARNSPVFGVIDELSLVNHIKFGVYTDNKGHLNSIFNERLSGIELSGSFHFNKKCC